jgi:predicted acylesterase/phospholipase RssA/ABC-type phosphate/phosphonate transport system substrate-binding protein
MVSAQRARRAGLWGLFVLWLLSGASAVAAEQTETPAPEVTIRVGIQPLSDDGLLKGEERQRYRRLCEQIANDMRDKHRQPIRLRVAVGSYADVYYWCENDMIDMAVVGAGVYSLLQERLSDRWVYLCTMSRRTGGKQFEDGVKCFTHAGAPTPNIEALRDAFGRGCLDVFLVDQKSVSGGIFPMSFLKAQDIPAYDEQMLERADGAVNHVFYTGSQKQTVMALCNAAADAGGSQNERIRIGFISDDAFQRAIDKAEPIQRVELEGLEAARIPGSAVVVRTSFYQRYRELLDRLPSHADFTPLPHYEEKYGRIRRWRDEFLPEPPTASERTDWPNFFRQLETYTQEQKQAPRIALVLAGGGAKCAFQVGVVQAIEDEFRRYRAQDFRRFAKPSSVRAGDFRIGLVVGTSGGAINALPAALGTYNTDAGVQTLRSTWQSLDARDILQPELAVRISLGVLLFLIQLVVVLLLVHVPWLGARVIAHEHRGRAVALALLFLGAGQLLWALSGWKIPWDFLYNIHEGLFVVWALATSGTIAVGVLLLAAAALVWLLDFHLRRKGSFLAMSPSATRETISWLMLVIVIATVPLALHSASFLSQVHGLEDRIAQAAEELINERLAARGQPPIQTRNLATLGRTILDDGLLERDLIITATILPEKGATVADTDVYFYASAANSDAGVVRRMLEDPRVQYLNEPERRGALLHAVMGSGAVFPVFPARTVLNCPSAGRKLQLVDGSFCHHNPIEAAAIWGATHVIVVNPSPAVSETTSAHERTLYENSQVAFMRLFEQAQNRDRRAEQDLTVFFINPEADKHNISLLSFARRPIADAIDHAQIELGQNQKPFRRQLSKPLFLPDLDTVKTATSDESRKR